MTFLDKLLDGETVEWKPLGEIAKFSQGLQVNISNQFLEKQEGFVRFLRIVDFVKKDEIPRYIRNPGQRYLKKDDDLIMIRYGAISAGRVFLNHSGAIANNMFKINLTTAMLTNKFLYSYLSLSKIYSNLNSNGGTSTMPAITFGQIGAIKIPIPCPNNPKKSLAIQAEIVRILDKFTALTAALTAEHAARKQQYEYYRDTLITFDRRDVEWKKLNVVAKIGTGSSNRQDESKSGLYPFYVRSKNVLRSNTFQFNEAAIIIPGEGKIGHIFHYVKGKYALHQRAYRISVFSENLNTKFLYYFMSSYFKKYILMKSVGTTAVSIRKPMLENFQIPIPSVSEQARIVASLDKFDALTNTITDGLPREITLRKQQYEYYRDTLLTFDSSDVEWKPLGEVCEIYGGLTGKTKKDFENGNAKYISYKNIFGNISVDFEKLHSVAVAPSEKQHLIRYGDVLFTGSSENPEDAGISSAVTKKLKDSVYLNSFSFGIRFHENITIDPEFSKYLFRSYFMRKEIAKTANGVTRFNVSKARFKKIKIPIPSVSEQARIVAILDKFDALTNSITDGLPREIALRKQQYKYYRDTLLTFDRRDVEWKKLGDVCEIYAGGDAPKDALSKSKTEKFNIPILSNGIGDKSLYGWTDKARVVKPSLTISARGTIGWISYRDRPFFPIVRLLVLTPKIKLNLKYAYYFMKTIESDYKIPETGIPQLTKPMLKDIKIPIPPLSEQARIVSILDKFDALTNTITDGLPREITLRKQQYEYYRDLLLNFPKPAD